MRAESSQAARTGAFIAVAVALFCIQLDFFALNLAVPGIADDFGVTASAAQWTLSAYMLAIASVATQQVVAPERAGQAAGVLLTFLVTLGGVALAGAAAAITAMEPGRSPEAAYDTILRFGGAVTLATSAVVMAVRHRLVVLGGVSPLGSRAPRDGRVP